MRCIMPATSEFPTAACRHRASEYPRAAPAEESNSPRTFDSRACRDPMWEVDSDRRSDRVQLETSHSGDEHASYSRSTRSAERYP